MLNTTLPRLRCPKKKQKNALCGGHLRLNSNSSPEAEVFEVRSGVLQCASCQSKFPILAGVAVLVNSVRDYLRSHAKGIAQAVPDSEIPREYLRDYLDAKAQIQVEHIEEDLEAERVISLYILNHYLRVQSTRIPWWKSQSGQGSLLMDELIRLYWDRGPFSQILKWVIQIKAKDPAIGDGVELGCGVGGLYTFLRPQLRSYLGVDSSFASVAIGRHLALGVPYRGSIRFPEDLLQGPVSRRLNLPAAIPFDGNADLIVGDLEAIPLVSGQYDLAIALNTIDMMDDPSALPQLQHRLLRKDGFAIQSCPYVWHPKVAQKLRKKVPDQFKSSSAQAVEWLYRQGGFTSVEGVPDIPWLFYKHLRQMEVYSVHALLAKKGG